MKQTAVEWLIEELGEYFPHEIGGIHLMVNAAKTMEKEQIIDAYCEGFKISAEGWNGEYGIKDFNNLKEEIEAEQYYNETYGS